MSRAAFVNAWPPNRTKRHRASTKQSSGYSTLHRLPIRRWTPSIAPSGLTVYSGASLAAWRGNVFLGALSGLNLRRLELQDGRVTHEEVLQIT
jgi:glucose/arabinose dehydrogenase